jgi:hypothetical protein
MVKVNCESYTEWQDRLHPKVGWNYLNKDDFVQTAMLPDNESYFIYEYMDYGDLTVGKEVDPSQISATIKRIKLRPFIARDENEDIYFRCMATNLDQAELIHDRLKGDGK